MGGKLKLILDRNNINSRIFIEFLLIKFLNLPYIEIVPYKHLPKIVLLEDDKIISNNIDEIINIFQGESSVLPIDGGNTKITSLTGNCGITDSTDITKSLTNKFIADSVSGVGTGVISGNFSSGVELKNAVAPSTLTKDFYTHEDYKRKAVSKKYKEIDDSDLKERDYSAEASAYKARFRRAVQKPKEPKKFSEEEKDELFDKISAFTCN